MSYLINLFRMAWRNMLRNSRRSFLTAATVTIGTAFVVVTLSFLGGIFDTMIDGWTQANGPIRVVTTAYAEREQLRPLHENIAESDPLVTQLEALDGVGLVAPILRTGVLVALGEELGEETAMLVGSTPEWYEQQVLALGDVTEGSWLTDDFEDEQVVLGSRAARNVGAKVGDEILLMGTTQYGSMAPISATVVGLLSGNTAVEYNAFVSLETARWMTDIPDGALELLVYPVDDSEAGVAAVAKALTDSLGEDYAVTPWYERALWVQTKPIVDVIDGVISGIIIFVMALAIFNTMTMSVLERTGEIGVLRAMGQSRLGAVVSFLLESLMIGLVGGVLGAIVGAGPALYMESNGISYGDEVLDEIGGEYAMTATIYADLTPDILVTAILVGLATAALGALLPSVRAASIPPYEAMRQR